MQFPFWSLQTVFSSEVGCRPVKGRVRRPTPKDLRRHVRLFDLEQLLNIHPAPNPGRTKAAFGRPPKAGVDAVQGKFVEEPHDFFIHMFTLNPFCGFPKTVTERTKWLLDNPS